MTAADLIAELQTSSVAQEGFKTAGMNWNNRELRGQDCTRIAGAQREGQKTHGLVNIRAGGPAAFGSKSNARKAASAQIAKIPFMLARYIARVYKP